MSTRDVIDTKNASKEDHLRPGNFDRPGGAVDTGPAASRSPNATPVPIDGEADTPIPKKNPNAPAANKAGARP